MPRTKSAEPTAPVGPRLVAKTARVKSAPTVSHEQIALRAYELFLQEGGGSDVSHWLRAEHELLESQVPMRPARKAAGARAKG
jgi:hypothetical protein